MSNVQIYSRKHNFELMSVLVIMGKHRLFFREHDIAMGIYTGFAQHIY
jgi:hypothetical protein